MPRITTIALDADDTLWQNEQFFRLTEQRFADLLRDYSDAPDLTERLISATARNLQFYGFGAKSFTLSMLETALEITEHRVPGTVIAEILAAGRELLDYPLETLPYVDAALEHLQQNYRLILITKGDLLDQERKLAASGLAEYFAAVEVVSDKTEAVYRRIFERHTEGAEHTIMAGNSLKSDILPALAAGAFAAYVPHDLTWSYEHAEEPVTEPRYARIAHLGELQQVIDQFVSDHMGR
ncbi:putative hydrolase of the HAD superfamily [Devosia subaequoris]|uniref:Putative hydrolase of the HAD superfamily n=1 Tax=Devosia subaequoris TaxID=395930 RepID=A0A7W6NBA4_9HYPH|nr:HAD family hydrolase [Devosia subaequoris]MBB4051807.1 putative hydrolase of the HAD superfamily [Devosia subaequoris]MCP1210966.1 HAD family hydrolase [Devosia subaequoris]